MQTKLNKQYKAGLVVDGIFGMNTKNVIRTVSRGVKGSITRIVQGMLYSFGYDPNAFDEIFESDVIMRWDPSKEKKLTVEANVAPKTEAAVISFQKQHGLKVDGVVGPKTWNQMF